MTSFLDRVTSLISRTVRDSHPNKVIEVNSDQYSNKIIRQRDESIVLYGDPQGESYDVVLHVPYTESVSQAFSLFRSRYVEEAEAKFQLYRDRIPILLQIAREINWVCSTREIQKICDLLREHPGWTLAHLFVEMGVTNSITIHAVHMVIDSPDLNTGISPLQLAVKNGNIQMVSCLLSQKASLNHLDYRGNSVFHYAADTSKEIINALTAESKARLNHRNGDGHTPLHKACLANKPECVKALLRAGADVNVPAIKAVNMSSEEPREPWLPSNVGDILHTYSNKLFTQDMKFGGTPLHWSCSREVIEALVEMHCDINALNFDERTALHIMVIRKRTECVVALLSHGADVNRPDKNGDTPLHLAVTTGVIPIVQALIAFGADVNFLNHSSVSPRHAIKDDKAGLKILYLLHSVGAKRCREEEVGCWKGCSTKENIDGDPPPVVLCMPERAALEELLKSYGAMQTKKHSEGGRLLCLDGGGIRGMLLSILLLELEEMLGEPIIHCFDWIAGTSTGGILALGLCSGKTLKDCLCLYFRMKDVAFAGSRPYNSEPLETMLKETLGTTTVMADLTHPKILITGVLADRKPVDLHLFRNYEAPNDILFQEPWVAFEPPPRPEEQPIWQAARATGAAPSYFRAFGRFLDGGLIANNPTLDAITEIHEYNLALTAVGRSDEVKPLSIVVSLGTGLVPVTRLKDIDVFRPEKLLDTAKLAMGISALGTLLVDQATASDGRVVDRARAWCSMIGVPYFRFNPQLSEDVAMDERSDEKLVNMLWETKAYMYANREKLEVLSTFLKSLGKK